MSAKNPLPLLRAIGILIICGFLLFEGGNAVAQSTQPETNGSGSPSPLPTTQITQDDDPPHMEFYGNIFDENAACVVIYPALNGCNMENFPGYVNWDGTKGVAIFCNTEPEVLPPYWYLAFSGCGSEIENIPVFDFSDSFSRNDISSPYGASTFSVLENKGSRASKKVGINKFMKFFNDLWPSRASRETATDAIENAGTSPAVRKSLPAENPYTRDLRERDHDREIAEIQALARTQQVEAIARRQRAAYATLEKWYGDEAIPETNKIVGKETLILTTQDGTELFPHLYEGVRIFHPTDRTQSIFVINTMKQGFIPNNPFRDVK